MRIPTVSGPVLLLLCACASPASAWAQSRVQVGYAIVTAVLGNISSLQVVETFGLSDGSTVAQGSAVPLALSNQASVLVSVDPTVLRDTGLAVANPGSTDAGVTLRLDNAVGQTVANRSIVVPATRQVARFVTEIFSGIPDLIQPFNGTLTLTSNIPIGITALRFRGPEFGNLPVGILSASPNPLPLLFGGSVGGPSAVLLPHFVAGGGWSSQIAMSNNGTFPMIARIDLFDQNGNPLTVTLNDQSGGSFTNLRIPAGGVAVLSTPSAANVTPAF